MNTPDQRDRFSAVAPVGFAVAASALLTVLVHATPLMDVAYRRPALHVATETAAALISLLAAQLVHDRFRQRLQSRDLLLTAALATFAATNLFFSAVPAIADDQSGPFGTWTRIAGQLLGSVLFASAALAPDRELHRPDLDLRRLLAGCAAVLALAAALIALAGDGLPAAINTGRTARAVDGLDIRSDASIVAAQATLMVVMVLAAAGFTRLALRGDTFSGWLAAGAAFGAFARLNYVVFPSQYSEYFHAGDILRLGFVLALAAGAALELRRTRELLAAAAIEQERRSLARDVHDGVAQDLAYIVQQGRRLLRDPGAAPALRSIVGAAERALDESRHVVATLARPGGESLGPALTRTAQETVGREGGRLRLEIDEAITVPSEVQEAVLRVVREALINARRHGMAETLAVTLRSKPLRVTVHDDGKGFDVAASRALPGHFGLNGMEARMHGIGGALAIESAHGSGTTVEIRLP
jgi:signal transduction histidine kinase